MLTVTGKVLGRKAPLFADWSVPLPTHLDIGNATLREIIAHIVRSEVEAFRDRQAKRQILRALTAAEILAAAEKGRVEMGKSDVPAQPVDDETAISTALQAFEDGLYLVVVDEKEYRELDNVIQLQPDSRITFIRLAMLAGG